MNFARILLCVVVLGCPVLAPGDDDLDPDRVLQEARELMKQGKYEEALQKHLWFHENALKTKPSLVGVRRSFALKDWADLGQKYPKARSALVGVRDKTSKRLIAGQGSVDLFRDVAAINSHLEKRDNTVVVFKTLHEKLPALAKDCYRVAEPDLLRGREYKLCSAYIPDPLSRFSEVAKKREDDLATDQRIGGNSDANIDRAFIRNTCQLLDVLVGAGRLTEAEQLRDRALDVMDTEELRDSMRKSLNGQ